VWKRAGGSNERLARVGKGTERVSLESREDVDLSFYSSLYSILHLHISSAISTLLLERIVCSIGSITSHLVVPEQTSSSLERVCLLFLDSLEFVEST
jgi:hypothetical protein